MEIRRQRELLKQKQAKKKAQLQRQIKAQEDDRKRQVMDSQIGVSSALKDAEEEDEAADKDLGPMLEVSRHSDDGAPAAGPSTGGRKPSAPSVAAPAEARDLQAYGAVVQIDEDEGEGCSTFPSVSSRDVFRDVFLPPSPLSIISLLARL